MTGKDIYKIWAPTNKKWVDWIRPVPFVEITRETKMFRPTEMILPCLEYLDPNDSTTAVLIDMPGAQSVEVGILCAKHGYRPIPIYNGVAEQEGARATSDNHSIHGALVWGASILSSVYIKEDAPPVFLMDSNRLHTKRIDTSIFDNSWDVYPQDLPSGNYFLKNGITKLILVSSSNKVPKDLKTVFAEYPKKKISLF